MTIFRPLPYTTCFDDIKRVTAIRLATTGTIIPGWRVPGTTGPVYLLSSGDLPSGSFPIELGLVVDAGAGTLDVVQDWGTGPSIGTMSEAQMNAALHDLAVGTDGQVVATSDDDTADPYPECAVDGNGNPEGEPGDDHTTGVINALAGLVVRFLTWSSRNHPSVNP